MKTVLTLNIGEDTYELTPTHRLTFRVDEPIQGMTPLVVNTQYIYKCIEIYQEWYSFKRIPRRGDKIIRDGVEATVLLVEGDNLFVKADKLYIWNK